MIGALGISSNISHKYPGKNDLVRVACLQMLYKGMMMIK